MLHLRPGHEAERKARARVRNQFPLATSAYTTDGAEVYDPVTAQRLGSAAAGDWAVERAWQSAADALIPSNTLN